MRRKSFITSPQGCLTLIFAIIGFIANIKDVIDFINDINNNVPRPLLTPNVTLSNDLFWSGAILFYGMAALALLVWMIVASRALGDFQSLFSAIILQILGSALFVVSYFYKFSIGPTIQNLFIGVALFIFLPLGVGYIIFILWFSASN